MQVRWDGLKLDGHNQDNSSLDQRRCAQDRRIRQARARRDLGRLRADSAARQRERHARDDVRRGAAEWKDLE